MMRKLLTAALFVLLAFSIAPVQAYADVSPPQDELLLIKKKKNLAALKAAEERKGGPCRGGCQIEGRQAEGAEKRTRCRKARMR